MKQTAKYLTILLMVLACGMMVSCGGGGDDDSTSIPPGLIGQWYKSSGAGKYSMQFTFKADGTGIGTINHNSIISMNSFAFKYSYKSNGLVECEGIRVMVDENGEDEVSTKLTFQYNEKTLTLKDADNSNWFGAVFTKSGSSYDGDDDNDDSGEKLNVSVNDLWGKWSLAGFGKSSNNFSGSNPGEYLEITSNYRITWGGQQNGRTEYYTFTFNNNVLTLTPSSGGGSKQSHEIVSFSSKEMVLYQSSTGYYRKWRK